MSKEKYKIKAYKKVGEKTKKYGLPIDSFIIFTKVAAYSVAGLGSLKVIFPIPFVAFLVLIVLLGIFYLILFYSNREGKDYFLLSRISRFSRQYKRIEIVDPKSITSNFKPSDA